MESTESSSQNFVENQSFQNDQALAQRAKKKKKKPGIVYLSTLPPYMNVTKIKDLLGNFAEIGRVFLQPAGSDMKRKKPSVHFSEGWIEFKSKRKAKAIASKLNNTQIGGKKSSKFYDYVWNIKYLSRFKWAHLGERLAYERAVHKQRLRAEIAQAKREASHFSATLEKRKKKLQIDAIPTNVRLRPTDDEVPKEAGDRAEFLKSLFS